MRDDLEMNLAKFLFSVIPVNNGYQYVKPAKIAKTAPIDRT